MVSPLLLLLTAKLAVIAINTFIPIWVEFVVRFAEEHLQSDRTDSGYSQLQTAVVLGCFTVFLFGMVRYIKQS